jgi:hypothetical protein
MLAILTEEFHIFPHFLREKNAEIIPWSVSVSASNN